MDSLDVIKGQLLYDTWRSASVVAASGTTQVAVWTPAAGKAIRMASYSMEAGGSTITGANATEIITLLCGGITIGIHCLRLTPSAVTGILSNFVREFEGGMLLPAGSAITVQVGVALTGGALTVQVLGREE